MKVKVNDWKGVVRACEACNHKENFAWFKIISCESSTITVVVTNNQKLIKQQEFNKCMTVV